MSKFAQMNRLWTSKNIVVPLKEFEYKSKEAMILALNFIGQKFIEEARNGGEYKDRTGNLRSSIGYAVYSNGKELNGVFVAAEKDIAGEGVKEARNTASQNASKTGLALIVVAGMDYAGAVESKGFNVLTVFAPTDSKIKGDLKRLLQYV